MEIIAALLREHPEEADIGLAQASYLLASTVLVVYLITFFAGLAPLYVVVGERWLIPLMRAQPVSTFMVACGCGLLMYVLRSTYRFYYGLLELGFALSALYVTAIKLNQDGAFALASLAGGLYVLVRALDNIAMGYQTPYIRKPSAPEPAENPSPSVPAVTTSAAVPREDAHA